jgi:hypothetical protein
MDPVTDRLDTCALSETDRIAQIWLVSSFLGIYSKMDQLKLHFAMRPRELTETYLTSPNSYTHQIEFSNGRKEKLTIHIASNSQSNPSPSSQLIITVLPSPSLAILSKVSMDTPSILLMTVKAGMYCRVPRYMSCCTSQAFVRNT